MKHVLLPVAAVLAAVVVASLFLSSKNHASSGLSMDGGGDQAEEILVDGGAVGPESLAFDEEGEGPYTGVSDGRILKWQGDGVGWTDFASVSPPHMLNECRGSQDPKREPLCGRPLGLCFNKKTGQLYIADAYFGLLMVDYKGKAATTVSMEAGGATFYFTNSLDIDHNNGVIYFTDSSQKFRRSNVEIFSNLGAGCHSNVKILANSDASYRSNIEILSNLCVGSHSNAKILADSGAGCRNNIEILSDLGASYHSNSKILSDLGVDCRNNAEILTTARSRSDQLRHGLFLRIGLL